MINQNWKSEMNLSTGHDVFEAVQAIQLRRKPRSQTGRLLLGSTGRWRILVFSSGFGLGGDGGRRSSALRVGLWVSIFNWTPWKAPLLALCDLKVAEHRHKHGCDDLGVFEKLVNELELELINVFAIRWWVCWCVWFDYKMMIGEEYLYWWSWN